MNYVFSGKKHGQLSKPTFNIVETTIKNDEYTMWVYNDSVNFRSIDTLIQYKGGKIVFNGIEVEKVDTKSIKNKNKRITVTKIYVPKIRNISVDNYAGKIIYLSNNGIIARYGIISNYISLYKPDEYKELKDKILNRKMNFKRNKNELEGLP